MSSTFAAQDGRNYHRMMGRWSLRLAPKLLAIADLPQVTRVLDAGCGTGSLSGVLRAAFPSAQIDGVDVAEGYLSVAREKHPDVRFGTGDLCALPFEDGRFDAALSLLVFQFIPETQQALKELRRVVRAGGVVATCVWDHFGISHFEMLMNVAAALGLTERRIRPMALPGDFTCAMLEAGYRDVTETSLTIRFEFESFEDYWNPFEAGEGPPGQLVAGLSEPDRARLKNCCREVYLSGRPDGPRSFPATANAARGLVP